MLVAGFDLSSWRDDEGDDVIGRLVAAAEADRFPPRTNNPNPDDTARLLKQPLPPPPASPADEWMANAAALERSKQIIMRLGFIFCRRRSPYHGS